MHGRLLNGGVCMAASALAASAVQPLTLNVEKMRTRCMGGDYSPPECNETAGDVGGKVGGVGDAASTYLS